MAFINLSRRAGVDEASTILAVLCCRAQVTVIARCHVVLTEVELRPRRIVVGSTGALAHACAAGSMFSCRMAASTDRYLRHSVHASGWLG